MLGYCTGPEQDTQLVVTPMDKARELCRGLPRQVVLHADRGTQSTRHQLR